VGPEAIEPTSHILTRSLFDRIREYLDDKFEQEQR
jgi:hypothetical protein